MKASRAVEIPPRLRPLRPARGAHALLSVVLVLVVGIGRPIGAQNTAGASDPITSLSALSSRVRPTQTIYVRTTSGEEIVGRFSRTSPVSLTLDVKGRVREIPAADVQRVWERGPSRAKRGMAFGFLAGAAIANIAALTASRSHSDWSTGDTILVGTLAGGGAGLIWGGLIGAFYHERAIVYQAAAPTVRSP